jgi:hypothetical protein
MGEETGAKQWVRRLGPTMGEETGDCLGSETGHDDDQTEGEEAVSNKKLAARVKVY